LLHANRSVKCCPEQPGAITDTGATDINTADTGAATAPSATADVPSLGVDTNSIGRSVNNVATDSVWEYLLLDGDSNSSPALMDMVSVVSSCEGHTTNSWSEIDDEYDEMMTSDLQQRTELGGSSSWTVHGTQGDGRPCYGHSGDLRSNSSDTRSLIVLLSLQQEQLQSVTTLTANNNNDNSWPREDGENDGSNCKAGIDNRTTCTGGYPESIFNQIGIANSLSNKNTVNPRRSLTKTGNCQNGFICIIEYHDISLLSILLNDDLDKLRVKWGGNGGRNCCNGELINRSVAENSHKDHQPK